MSIFTTEIDHHKKSKSKPLEGYPFQRFCSCKNNSINDLRYRP